MENGLTVEHQNQLEVAKEMIEVFVENGEAKTDTLTIASVFGKEHKRVMRDVRETNCSEEFRQGNFAPSEYLNKQGRKQIKYDITFDGFMFLVMGYTGKLAGHIKEAYINKFNEMKDSLKVDVPSYVIDDPIERAKQWIIEQEKVQKLEQQNAINTQIIGELKPKADYTDEVLKTKNAVNIGQIANDYGVSAQVINQLLHELRIQYKNGGQWVTYAEYRDKGYTESTTGTAGNGYSYIHTKWTQKGRLFIYDLLKNEKNMLPTIEQDSGKHAFGETKKLSIVK